jgi:hypothetical protein
MKYFLKPNGFAKFPSLILAFVFILVILLLQGLNIPIKAETFSDKMNKLGYELLKPNEIYNEIMPNKQYVIYDDSMVIIFSEFYKRDHTNIIYKYYEKYFEEFSRNNNLDLELRSNYHYINSPDKYYIVKKVGKTIFYAECNLNSINKVNKILKYIGYY